jgi:hypothetical protein
MLVTLLSVFLLASCATSRPRIASKQDILATTKRLSAPGCLPSVHWDGCSYDAIFVEGQWQVVAVPYQVVGGERLHAASGSMYIFNANGNLIRVVPGM